MKIVKIRQKRRPADVSNLRVKGQNHVPSQYYFISVAVCCIMLGGGGKMSARGDLERVRSAKRKIKVLSFFPLQSSPSWRLGRTLYVHFKKKFGRRDLAAN